MLALFLSARTGIYQVGAHFTNRTVINLKTLNHPGLQPRSQGLSSSHPLERETLGTRLPGLALIGFLKKKKYSKIPNLLQGVGMFI